MKVTFPDDYPAEHLAGKDAVFAVEVKEVKEKRLPELDDEFAVEAGGYDSLDELRDDIATRARARRRSADRGRVPRGRGRRGGRERRARGPARAGPREGARDVAPHRPPPCSAQGIDPASYLQMTGKDEEELVTEAEPEAELALKREAVLAAIVEAEGIEVDRRGGGGGAARRRRAARREPPARSSSSAR